MWGPGYQGAVEGGVGAEDMLDHPTWSKEFSLSKTLSPHHSPPPLSAVGYFIQDPFRIKVIRPGSLLV